MKFSSQEEYGLRCLLCLAREREGGGSLAIPAISQAEGISTTYVAKLMRILRRGGFVKSARGKIGGYTLSRPPDQIVVGEVLTLLGGRLFEPEFCDEHAGDLDVCTNSTDCSLRSLWRAVQFVVDQVLRKTTLKDLLCNEQEMTFWVSGLLNLSGKPDLKQLSKPL